MRSGDLFRAILVAIVLIILAGWLALIIRYFQTLGAIAAAPIPTGGQIQVAAAELRAAERNLESLQVMLQVAVIFTVFVPVLLAILATLYASEWVDERIEKRLSEVEERATKQIRKDFQGEINRTRAFLYSHLGVVEWRRLHDARDLDQAITFARGALSVVDPVHADVSAVIKSNLAYYYAEAGKLDRKEEALRFASEARAYYSVRSEPGWEFLLANDVYVRMRYANACDIKTLQPVADEIRDLMAFHPNLQMELTGYLSELRGKCPAVV